MNSGRVLAECVERLPSRLGHLFALRGIDGLASDEVREILNITAANNLWIMLSRMRLQLRNSLDSRWFGQHGS